MKKLMFFSVMSSFFLFQALFCPAEIKEPATNHGVYEISSVEKCFGFYGQNRYSYCPSLVRETDGTVHMFFCGNPREDEMVDNIYHIRIHTDGAQTLPKSVLQPGPPGEHDDHHVCDPSVVEGEFGMDGQVYRYAMFYLTNRHGVRYNEIGVAFSNDLDADHWEKYPERFVKKPWDSTGDLVHPNGRTAWGVGQPSAFSIDGKGSIVLTYTRDDSQGTRIVWFESDLSDMDHYVEPVPVPMTKEGLVNLDGSKKDYTCNSDFAVDLKNDIIVMARPVQPNSRIYPTYINTVLEIDQMKLSDFLRSRGIWTPMMRITSEATGFPCNHNAGLERTSFGAIDNWEEPVVYYTVSQAAPDVEPAPGRHAEWTYHLWKCRIKKR